MPSQGDSGTTGIVENRLGNEEALSALGDIKVHSSLAGEVGARGGYFDVEEGYKYIFSDDSSIVPPRGSVFACDESADQTNLFSDEIFLPRKVSGAPPKHKPFLTPKQDPKTSSLNTDTLKISTAVDIRTGENIDIIEIDSDNLLSAEELLDDDDIDVVEEVKHGMRDPGTSSTGVEDADSNDDVCFVCNEGGDLICCDECPRSYHLQCYVEQYYGGDLEVKKEIDEETEFACKECDEFVDDEDYDDDEMESCMVNDWKQLWGPGGLMRHLTDSRLNQGRTGSAPLPEEMLNSQEITEDFDSQKGSAVGWRKFVDAPVEKFEQITREIEQNQKDRPEMYRLGLSKISIAKREREVMEFYVSKEKAAKAAAKAQRSGDVAAQSNVRKQTVDLARPNAKRQKLDSIGKSSTTPWLAQAAELNQTVKNTQNQNNFESQTKTNVYPIVVNTTTVAAPAYMGVNRSKPFHPKGDSNARARAAGCHTHGDFELLDHENQDVRASTDYSETKMEALNLKYANDGIYGPPLICAVKHGNLEDVKYFVQHGIDPATISSSRGDTVLHHVGVSKVLEYLLNNCSSLENIIDKRNYSNDTPLMVAVRNNCVKTVKILLEIAHCDSGIKGGDGCSPLSIAMLNRNLEIVLLLKTDGASVCPVQPHFNSAVENFENTNEVEVGKRTHTNCRACGKKQAGQREWLDQNKELQLLCVGCFNTICSLENPPRRGYCIL